MVSTSKIIKIKHSIKNRNEKIGPFLIEDGIPHSKALSSIKEELSYLLIKNTNPNKPSTTKIVIKTLNNTTFGIFPLE